MWLETFAVFVVMCWVFTWELLTGERPRRALLPRRQDRGVR
jgi:hypothetical protein